MAAAAVVSVSMGVMKPVLAKLATLMGDEYKKIKGLQKEVIFLQSELRYMDALLEKMDCADELDPLDKQWRRDIIEMSYNIEDRIDDFMHTIGEADDKNIGILLKAAKYLRTFSDRRRLANDFQEIKTLVIETSDRRKRYMSDQCISVAAPVVVDPRVSALYKKSSSLVGIDAKKAELVSWAMDEDKQLKFMAIVGFGGIGKTTLANELYREVAGKFECKAFISVSQKPQIIELFNSLLSQLGQQTYSHNTSHLPDPINGLRGHLQDKRYFIVVDDLWKREAWDVIKCAFPQNNQCSRVMITTRDENVSETCCSTSGIIHNMKPLSEPDSRKLFFITRIFGSEDDCPSEFEEVSCAILKRCGGLPLAILTVAGILASQKTNLREAWEYIRTELTPQVETNNVDYEKMMDILDLSYKHLPRHLKACFLYFGTYPEDDVIMKAELVRRWVAEGFVSVSTEQNVWDAGESYLNELVNRSMIQPGESLFVSGYRVHDMMLDLIIRKCKEYNFLNFINEPEAMASAVKGKVIRRLTIDLRDPDQGGPMLMTTAAGNLSNVRSVTMFEVSSWSIPLLLELKFVRVLWLNVNGYDGVDISGIINRLSHLRYLMIKGFCTVKPLAEIRGLRLLETLDLSNLDIPSFSLDLFDVPRLSHLNMPYGWALPPGIAEMKQLRTLHGPSLPSSSLESIQGLGELTGLTELSLVSEPSPMATWMVALCTCLEKLGKLRLLQVPCVSGGDDYIDHCADPLSLLSPPFGNSLEWLSLGFWTFTIVPRWVGHMQCLQELSIGVKQIIQQDVAIIGMLPKLITLRLRIVHVPMTRLVIGGGGGLFTLVKEFSFDCNGISPLTFEAGAMPSLRRLTLAFDIHHWDRATPEGLQHLSCLKQIHIYYRVSKDCSRPMDDEADDVVLMSVFQETVDAFLTPPELIFDDCKLFRYM